MATRMVPFKFSATVTYMIEMGDLYMSFFFDGALLNGDGAPLYRHQQPKRIRCGTGGRRVPR